MVTSGKSQQPARVFISYSHRDERYAEELKHHLSVLERTGKVELWSDRTIRAGANWDDEISKGLDTAQIILLLISPDFLASDYIHSTELQRGLQRSQAGGTRIIPIILRPSLWQEVPLIKDLQVLPRDGRPLASSTDRDADYVQITRAIISMVDDIQTTDAELPAKTTREIYPVYDVFKPSGVPTVTFVEPQDFNLLKLSVAQPGRGVVIEGPSGIGKTTAIKKAIEQAFPELSADQSVILSARNQEHLDRILAIQTWHKGIVVVDDFHRLEINIRTMLIDYLKYLADYEISDRKLIIVGIPETGRKLAQVSFDIATRIQIFKFGKVSDSLILSMIQKGEQALNIQFRQKTEIATAAAGSLNVAQLLCYHIVIQEGIEKTAQQTKRVEADLELAIQRVMSHMDLKYNHVIHSFAWLGGHKDHTAIELLQELARTPDGYLPLIPLKETRPDLAKGIDKFIKDKAMALFKLQCPDGEKHLLLDENTPALFIDDPQLSFYLLKTPSNQLAKDTGKITAGLRNRVFVSYSHVDEEWLERLRTHLKPLERDGLIDLWADTRIQAGALWRDEIKQAIDSTKVALLLISASFLASDFIANEELPPLLEKAKKDGTIVIPVIVSPSLFTSTPSLSQFQASNSPSKPLSSLDWNKQEEELVKVAQATIDAIEY